jgi:ketosteroid isomerase-like protein
MVSPNLELVRSIYAGWECGDFSAAEWAHPAIAFTIVGGPDPGSWTGVDGMAVGWYRFLEAWEDFHVTADEHRELDDERVLALIRRSGRGRASRMEVAEMHSTAADLFYVCDGMVIRLVHYWEREHALADLGLAAEADSSRS